MSSPVADFELTVAGYARLFGGQLDDEVRAVLRDGLGDSPEGDWAAVFAYARYPDGTVEKVTIFTSEVGYAQRLAGPAGGRIPLPMATVQQRFPKVRPGWVIDNGEEPPGDEGGHQVRIVADDGGNQPDAGPLAPAAAGPVLAGLGAPGAARRRARARHRLRRE